MLNIHESTVRLWKAMKPKKEKQMKKENWEQARDKWNEIVNCVRDKRRPIEVNEKCGYCVEYRIGSSYSICGNCPLRASNFCNYEKITGVVFYDFLDTIECIRKAADLKYFNSEKAWADALDLATKMYNRIMEDEVKEEYCCNDFALRANGPDTPCAKMVKDCLLGWKIYTRDWNDKRAVAIIKFCPFCGEGLK